MLSVRLFSVAVLLGSASVPVLPVVQANAASFDCKAAKTPYEKAICNDPNLSRADELLAKTFATAIGGLTESSVAAMRADQRHWLAFAQRACTDDAKPLTTGAYDDKGVECLGSVLADRSKLLEQSRMQGGHRFFVKTYYDVRIDPNEVDNPDSYWKLATQVAVIPQLDGDDPIAEGFNAFVAEVAKQTLDMFGGTSDQDDTSDSTYTVTVDEVVGTGRITLKSDSFWYGHGAAHGNWGTSYDHYLVKENRALVASDIFAGANWEEVLRDAAWKQLESQHTEWLFVDDAEEIADVVIDPRRWVLSGDYGLVIQFQPYEIAAYAYGAPTVTIPWDQLEDIEAETQQTYRYGF